MQDLRVASPATVSRCGMVYVPSDVVGWKPPAITWVEALSEDIPLPIRQQIQSHIEKYVQPGILSACLCSN